MINYQLAGKEFQQWNELFQFLVDAFSYMVDRIEPPSSLFSMNANLLRQKAEDEQLVIAKDEQIIVGCAFFRDVGDVIYIGKLAVGEPYRRKGIAATLIDMAEQQAKNSGRGYLELETRIELIENHATFKKLGFVKSGEKAHPGYSKPTSITMRKLIESSHDQSNRHHRPG